MAQEAAAAAAAAVSRATVVMEGHGEVVVNTRRSAPVEAGAGASVGLAADGLEVMGASQVEVVVWVGGANNHQAGQAAMGEVALGVGLVERPEEEEEFLVAMDSRVAAESTLVEPAAEVKVEVGAWEAAVTMESARRVAEGCSQQKVLVVEAAAGETAVVVEQAALEAASQEKAEEGDTQRAGREEVEKEARVGAQLATVARQGEAANSRLEGRVAEEEATKADV